MAFPKWPGVKDPDDILDYAIDWTNRLDEDDTIDQVTWEVVEGEVLIDDEQVIGNEAIVWLSGGANGETALVLCRIRMVSGRQMDQTIGIKIKTK